MAHTDHLRALIEIRRHITGFQNEMESKLPTIQRRQQQSVMNKEKEIENAWTSMDITGIGPQQLLTYTQIQIQHCIEGQIFCVRKLLHGKLRSDLRQKSAKLLQNERKRSKKGN